MEPNEASTNLDRQLIARNVRIARRNQGLSQSELAERSGVDLASVFRVEKGIRARTGTIRKIATGLKVIFEDLLINKTIMDPGVHLAVNRAAHAKWFPVEDKRHRVPDNQEELSQDPVERNRLGKLRLVPWFMCPPTVIPASGPGLVLLEIHDRMAEGRFNADFYENAAVYSLRGAARVTIAGESVDLGEGDWVAFKSNELMSITVLPPHEVALCLWIGSTRSSKKHPSHFPPKT